MRAWLIAAILGLASSSAQAYCLNLPATDLPSQSIANSTERTVCLQQDLSDKITLRQEIQSQTDAAMAQIQADMKLQQMQQQIRDAQQDLRIP